MFRQQPTNEPATGPMRGEDAVGCTLAGGMAGNIQKASGWSCGRCGARTSASLQSRAPGCKRDILQTSAHPEASCVSGVEYDEHTSCEVKIGDGAKHQVKLTLLVGGALGGRIRGVALRHAPKLPSHTASVARECAIAAKGTNI